MTTRGREPTSYLRPHILWSIPGGLQKLVNSFQNSTPYLQKDNNKRKLGANERQGANEPSLDLVSK